MTIKEVEAALDMTRGNIRFYEAEGLLSPRRNDNRYRDYSEEDLDILRKIKLFRQLHLSVETIKQVQSGATELSKAVEDQLGKLNNDIHELSQAQSVCHSIISDNARYADIDANKYLYEIRESASRGVGYFEVKSDVLPTVAHPWRRYLARSLDLSVYAVIWSAITNLVLRWNLQTGFWETLFNSYVAVGLMLITEPLLLSTLGTTLGKWIFGLKLRNWDGKKLTYNQAINRTFGVFSKGLGYNIPVYSLIRTYKCYKPCTEGQQFSWDDDCVYRIKDKKPIRGVVYALATIVMIAFACLIILQTQIPINRGDITAAQYAENVNYTVRCNRLDYAMEMDDSGEWIEDQDSNVVYIGWGEDFPKHQIITENGLVTEIRIEVVCTEELFIWPYINQKFLAAMAFIGAQDGVNCLNLKRGDLLDLLKNDFANYTFSKGGVTVTNTVEYSGYELMGSDLYPCPQESGEHYFHMVFTMEKTS